jgi:hypothetical protein
VSKIKVANPIVEMDGDDWRADKICNENRFTDIGSPTAHNLRPAIVRARIKSCDNLACGLFAGGRDKCVDQSSTRRAEKQSRETQSEPHVFEIAFIDALWMLKEDAIDHVFCSDTLVLVNMT